MSPFLQIESSSKHYQRDLNIQHKNLYFSSFSSQLEGIKNLYDLTGYLCFVLDFESCSINFFESVLEVFLYVVFFQRIVWKDLKIFSKAKKHLLFNKWQSVIMKI